MKLPETERFPLDEEKIKSHNPEERYAYFKTLIKRLNDVYSKIASAVNQNHALNHQDGGTDEINVQGLSGELADLQKVKDHTHQSAGSGVGGKLDHGLALEGLLDDDHTQYLLLAGRAGGQTISGNLDATGNLGTAWTDVTFSTGWSNYGSGYQTVQYKKFGDLVFIRGLADSGGNSWSTYPTIFVLPTGYRPLAGLIFVAMAKSNAAIRLDINSNGEVNWNSGGYGSGWLSLDGIIFSTG